MNNLKIWWCPYCLSEVDPVNVTFDELHDTRSGGCGARVEIITPKGAINQQTQTMNTISDNEYYHVRYYMDYAEMYGPWKIQTGQEIQVHGSNVKTQIVGPIERPGND